MLEFAGCFRLKGRFFILAIGCKTKGVAYSLGVNLPPEDNVNPPPENDNYRWKGQDEKPINGYKVADRKSNARSRWGERGKAYRHHTWKQGRKTQYRPV